MKVIGLQHLDLNKLLVPTTPIHGSNKQIIQEKHQTDPCRRVSSDPLTISSDGFSEDLKTQLNQGYVLLNHYQTLCFIKVNDLLCKILLTGEEGDRINLFILISGLSRRFKTLAKFETYYLDYSTQVITRVKEEFYKEPGLRDKLDELLRT
ncbi:hypothetical protein [Pedobacter sp. CFBP9032]|uniref:hypothetical protein n=1 Tax=Pedobacter sp. CFBP9032 TaxID=3096539 RepID=UPI002A6A3B39|nr:hypothetical protein [Pedobacter sp. CFBP9032]MDY0907184.1 hypothetical protein [Pedobacter sp. CFBP9032]